MKLRMLLRAAAIAMAVVGTTATPRAEDAPPAPSSTASYYLLQLVSPPKAVISIAQGKIIDGAFHADGTVFVNQTFKGTATDGFVFAKAAPDTTQGIRVIRMSDSMFESVYVPCLSDFKTLAFDTQKGKVVYAGTVEYAYAADGKIGASYGQDIEAARAFLKSHYPQLADELTPGMTYQVSGSRC